MRNGCEKETGRRSTALSSRINLPLNRWELDKANSRFNQTQLDTAQMRQSRDELTNLKYAAEERAIVLDQSKFEPPRHHQTGEIALEKAKRAYEQAHGELQDQDPAEC